MLFILFIFATAVFFNSRWHQRLKLFFSLPEREVLSVASGPIFSDGQTGRVVKLLTRRGVILEIYGPTAADNVQPLFDQIELKDLRDAQFQFRGRATNLALKDMDGDRIFEIIAPTYDSSLLPRLNIFRYNKDTQKFEVYLE